MSKRTNDTLVAPYFFASAPCAPPPNSWAQPPSKH